MKTNLWSMKTGLPLFAIGVVAVVLFEHVRGLEPSGRAERCSAAQKWNNVHGAGLINIENGGAASDSPANDGPASGSADDLTAEDETSEGPCITVLDAKTKLDDLTAEDKISESEAAETVEEAIHDTADAFIAAFDRGDAASIAALWTVDGEYIDGTGTHVVGRAAIERQYAQFFAEHPGAKIEIAIDAIRPISDDAAIEDGRAALLPRAAGATPGSPYSVIHVKVDDRWLMASVREPPAGQSADNDPLASLDWLVGSWRADQNGARMDVTFRWIANRSFLERTYVVEQGGRITVSGVQLIGQDPSSRELQSWNFTSDAGFAVGNWIARPDGWAIVTRGKLPDGTTTGAVNYLTRLDENTLSWQSRERKAGEVSLPDTDAVQLARVTESP